MQGHLTVITGPMFAGKSTELLKRIQWANQGEKRKILVLKPKMDERYSVKKIVSHDGYSTLAQNIDRWPEYPDNIEEIFIDEVQFLTNPYYEGDLVQDVKNTLSKNISITVSGLDMNWKGQPFFIMAALLAMADDVLKFKSECVVCGRPASHTGKKLPDDEIVALGSQDIYEPLCNKHWKASE